MAQHEKHRTQKSRAQHNSRPHRQVLPISILQENKTKKTKLMETTKLPRKLNVF
jgi:hypothetical protein